MGIFKKRVVIEEKLIKSLTILDAETQEVKEIFDIIDENTIKEIVLSDENLEKYSEIQLKDMSFMSGLRDTYPDMKDMETFLTDACKSAKLLKDEQLTDEQIAAEKEKVDALAKAEGVAAQLLLDAELKEKDAEKARQIEIEEAERARHEAAQ